MEGGEPAVRLASLRWLILRELNGREGVRGVFERIQLLKKARPKKRPPGKGGR